jgi:hypothetical protein
MNEEIYIVWCLLSLKIVAILWLLIFFLVLNHLRHSKLKRLMLFARWWWFTYDHINSIFFINHYDNFYVLAKFEG